LAQATQERILTAQQHILDQQESAFPRRRIQEMLEGDDDLTELTEAVWGALPSGEQIRLYTLRNAAGVEISITNYGGRIVTVKIPDRDGRFADVALGFDDLDGYLRKNPFFGALVGRYANRIANGEFKLDGTTYHLPRNNGENSLHGGLKGFDKVAWKTQSTHTKDGPALRLEYVSADGEEGYPGKLTAIVTYSLSDTNELSIEYEATTDKSTVLNLTNHSYFDLSGQGSGKILDHVATIYADRITPVNSHLIPTGELQPVDGTPFDFRQPTRIGERIDQDDQQLKYGAGYDHNYVLNRKSEGLQLAARVLDPASGRTVEALTTQPGMQFYTGNHLAESLVRGKGGVVYGFRSGFCLETQHFPDSPNQPQFPSTELKPGARFEQTTVFRFSVDGR
jgi:aldose 1-epimerase